MADPNPISPPPQEPSPRAAASGPGNEVVLWVPRWAQAVLLPVALLVGLLLGQAVSHALFAFLLALLLTLLLNPLVQGLSLVRVPRVAAVPLVYLFFVAVLVVLLVVGVPVLIRQLQAIADSIPGWGRSLEDGVARLQGYLDSRSIPVDVAAGLGQVVDWLETHSVQSAGAVVNAGLGLAGSLGTLLVIIIASFYMLIDGARIHRYLCRVLPADEQVVDRYLHGLQTSFTRYVKGQAIVGLTMALLAGAGVWAFGVLGIWPEGLQYALLLAVWAGAMELVPYVGPWIGGTPPVVLAFFHSPMTAVWVLILFVVLQQIEGHVLVPNIMGTTVGVHPLVVIFVLLAAFQVAGIVGMLAVLPLLSMVKHTIDFFDFRLSRARWVAEDRGPPAGAAKPDGTPPTAGPAASPEAVVSVTARAEAPPQEGAPMGTLEEAESRTR